MVDIGVRPNLIVWLSLLLCCPRAVVGWLLMAMPMAVRVVSDKLRGACHTASTVRRHPSNQGHMLVALTRAYKYQFQSEFRRGAPVPIRTGFGPMLRVTSLHHASTRAAFASLPDLHEMSFWKSWLRPGDLFVDVGANVGLYALLAASLGSEVIAVEADADACAELRANVEANGFGSRVIIVQAAATSTPGAVTFTVGHDEMNRMTVGHDDAQFRVVRGVTLDSLIGDRVVRGCKIDVEGAERLVLEGARQCLRDARIEALQLEWNFTSRENFGEDRSLALACLTQAGYTTARPDAAGRLHLGAAGEGRDLFAIPKSASVAR